MTYTLALEPADEALIESYAARENLSVPDFIRRTVMEAIKRRAHVPRPKARDEMTDEEFDAMLEQGYQESLTREGIPVDEMFARIYKKYGLEAL